MSSLCTVFENRRASSIDSTAVDIWDHSSMTVILNLCTNCPNSPEIQLSKCNAEKESKLKYLEKKVFLLNILLYVVNQDFLGRICSPNL